MPKNANKRHRGEAWSGQDHAIRLAKQQKQQKSSYKERRMIALTRGSQDKIDSGKLKLHITKTQREVDRMRERLKKWDDEAEKPKAPPEQEPAKKRKGRKGPESWKLRGAARPAWEVYDFDTRYVDPHVEAHKRSQQKAERTRNILSIYKGRLGEDNGPPPEARTFLSLLMQLGMLCLQAKKYKTARSAFLECLELDGTDTPITLARCRLMRMYMEANRPDSARRLWERLAGDTSIWIRYSAALIEYVSWKLLGETGSSRQSALARLTEAIQANVFCAYYIAYHDTFESIMEYTDEIQDASSDEPLHEAIEYCCSEQMGAWVGTDGAITWLQRVIVRTLNDNSIGNTTANNLTKSDLEWSDKLKKIEDDYAVSSDDQGEKEHPHEEDEEEVDVLMYAGMFRTAMDMLQDAGEFVKIVEENEEEAEETPPEDNQDEPSTSYPDNGPTNDSDVDSKDSSSSDSG